MQEFNLLVLTDHTNHSVENSLYSLVRAMKKHPACCHIDVASRGITFNDDFFRKRKNVPIQVTKIIDDFKFSSSGEAFLQNLAITKITDYDAVWLRMPPPLTVYFLNFLIKEFPNTLFINDPNGIYIAGSKGFLTNFLDYTPPMRICRSIKDIVRFKSKFPIVLKPFREYGGKGIVKIDGEQVWEGKKTMNFSEFVAKIDEESMEYLGVKFLKNVSKGDKRIVVVDGQIMGASLRLPATDSWICNVAMGGSSHYAKVDKDEINMIKKINPTLTKMGIVMYGVDTLVGDNGRRVLSEINTTSIGGLPQISQLMGKPLVEEATDLIWDYIIRKNKNNHESTDKK